MNKKIIASLYKKEMLDVLRDKKTVLMMIVVPLLLYPLLFVVGLQFVNSITKDIDETTYRVAFDYEVEKELLQQFMDRDSLSKEEYSFELYEVEDCLTALGNGQIDVYIERIDEGEKPEYRIHYLSSVNNSVYASDKAAEVLNLYSRSITVSIIEELGLDADKVLQPINIIYADMSTKEESAGNMLGIMLPFMLIFSILLGTMYPAIDTTAGERERGTLETVLTLPITNRQLIVSKFLAVSTIGLVSALLNIISMGCVGAYTFSMVSTVSDEKLDMSKFIPAILVGILCVIAFSVFISAVTMCVCAFAKTYKEANNYITPLTLVIMFASFVEFLPNVVLTGRMALMPVANICLLIRDILAFKFDIGVIAIVLVSNVAYGIMAVMFLGKIYNSESILFGDGKETTLLFEKRSNMIKGGVPSTGDAWLVMAVAAVAIIYAGGSALLKYGMTGVIMTQLIIAGIPLAAAAYSKKDMRKTFRLKRCSSMQMVSSVIIMIGMMMLGIVLTGVTSSIFRESASNADVSMESLLGDTFIVTLLIVAVLPAICEELMFRGYILTAMEDKLKPLNAILISAALFGVYHMSVVKFFTTALIGLAICYVAHKTKSIVPGMLMHFINNGLSCVIMYFPDEAGRIIPIFADEEISVMDAAVLLVVGALLVLIGKHLIDVNSDIESLEKQ